MKAIPYPLAVSPVRRATHSLLMIVFTILFLIFVSIVTRLGAARLVPGYAVLDEFHTLKVEEPTKASDLPHFHYRSVNNH
jgi:hypothetical protein